MSEPETTQTPAAAPPDPADEAMCARARERFTGDRKSRLRRRRKRHAALPNLIIVGGLKCGTTSIHHYLGLHPEIQMSKPKELNFFVEELNWDLGLDWYASRFDGRFEVRGESSPHYTNLPRFHGVAPRIKEHCADARLIYMVRDPIKRILSHWVHASGAGYETRELVATLSQPDSSYVQRSMYWMQLQPYLELFDRSQIAVIAQEELQREREETMRKAFAFAGVDPAFTSEQFDREWEKSSAKQGDKYQVMEKLVKLPGLRSFDRNFDRLPESLRWIVEKVVHDPEKPPAPKPELPAELLETLRGRFGADVAALQEFAGREFAGWSSYP
ncbi:MAG TPA: sulfotransferase domain-containing protein [Solirubrobacterales bacterium]|nr:sulfotransferase domain-containing protein [Solirubrobacterales bacterium]